MLEVSVLHQQIGDLLDDVPQSQLEKVRAGLDRLTPRELEVLKRAISGETAGNSASNLGISVRTVELHRQQVLAKLDVKNLTQAVRMIALVQRSYTEH
jgi:two-component system response regulator FixJ